MARKAEVSPSTLGRIWRRDGLNAHLPKTLELSNDKDFERNFWGEIGLYLDPPKQSVVLRREDEISTLGAPPAGAAAGLRPHQHAYA